MGEVEDRWENPAIATVTLPGSLFEDGRYLQNRRYVKWKFVKWKIPVDAIPEIRVRGSGDPDRSRRILR